LYDPLFHLNHPPQPPALRELFQSLPRGYSLPTNSRNGSLFGGDDIEGDGNQLDMGVLEFNRVTPSVGKGRGGKLPNILQLKNKEQLNGKYKILRNLIQNPTKVYNTSSMNFQTNTEHTNSYKCNNVSYFNF